MDIHHEKDISDTDRKDTTTVSDSDRSLHDEDHPDMIGKRMIEKKEMPCYPFFFPFSKEYHQLLLENRRLKQELRRFTEEQSQRNQSPLSPPSSSFFSKWGLSSFSLEEKDLWYFWI